MSHKHQVLCTTSTYYKVGKILSGKPLDTPNESADNFKNAIITLFPIEYHKHQDALYTELRCGMLHFFGPKSKVILGDTEHPGQNYHLTFNPRGKLILLFNEFHRDFELAANKLIQSKDVSIRRKLNEFFFGVGPANLI